MFRNDTFTIFPTQLLLIVCLLLFFIEIRFYSYHALRCRVKTCRIFDFRNDREKKNFIVCGAAAGVAAAFGAPLGGVMFCLEEGASWWHPKITWRTFFAAVVSSFFTTLVLSGFGPGDVWDWSYFGTNVSSGVFTVRGRNLDLQVHALQYSHNERMHSCVFRFAGS